MKDKEPRKTSRQSVTRAPIIVIAGVVLVSLAYFASRYLPVSEAPSSSTEEPPVQLPSEFRIGIITDVHGQTGKQYSFRFMDPDKVMRPLYRFEGYMQDVFRPNVIVQDGDLIEGSNRLGDKSVADFSFLRDELDRSAGAPVLHVIGNHDRRGFHDDTIWKSLTGNDSTFYFRDYDDVRIVILDYDDADRNADLADDSEGSVSSGAKYTISENQLDWLKRTLEDAGRRRIVVFTHVPINENAILPGNLVNPPGERQRLRDLFATYGVKAVVSGHAEIFRFEEDRGVRYFALPGFHRSEAKSKPEKWYGTYSALTVADRAEMLVRYEKEFGGAYDEVRVPSEAFDTLPK
ncbi:MAG: hypothetical protein HGA38_00845 [Candidatus Moranbacteria bacterium]|nr:hypothetical protein [Candidatus Moranbacteria bacterium]